MSFVSWQSTFFLQVVWFYYLDFPPFSVVEDEIVKHILQMDIHVNSMEYQGMPVISAVQDMSGL